jgi:hypothetical protein
MAEGYFQRLHREMPDRLWINNPITATEVFAMARAIEVPELYQRVSQSMISSKQIRPSHPAFSRRQ